MSTTKDEIERIAQILGKGGLKTTDYRRDVQEHAGHLCGDDLVAVLYRAAEIGREIAVKAQAEADGAMALYRLARAAGCPEDVPALPWLHERGLVDQRDDGTYFLSNKPGPAQL